MKIGYSRVSTHDQSTDLQNDALNKAGCEMLFTDEGASGAAKNRRGLDEALNALKAGDTFIVWRLDRLGRSLPHLINLVSELGGRGVEFVSLTEHIDTTTAGGKLVFHMMGALAEFERSLIVERTNAGLAAARKRGKRLGRPPVLSPEQLHHAKQAIAGGETVTGMASILGVDRKTLSRALNKTPL